MTKDTVCRDFLKGYCRFEGQCRFDHPTGKGGESQTKPDATVCKDYARGNCTYGSRCRFSHPVPCKDFLQGDCKFKNCKFYHPPGAAGAASRGPKRPLIDAPGGFDEPEYCRDFVYNGVCRRIRCSYLHEMPNKRQRGPDGPHQRGPDGPHQYGPDGPHQGGPGPMGPPAYDGPAAGSVSNHMAMEMKAYIGQLELKVTMYEEKIKDLEKRCEQYEDFNKLLTERNDELKEKLDKELSRGSGGGSGGGYYTSNGSAGYSSNHRSSSSRPNYY